MLSFKVSDGTFLIEEHPTVKSIYYVHFIEGNKIDYGIAFIGNYTACVIYCKQRQIEYLEREIEILKSQDEPCYYLEHE